MTFWLTIALWILVVYFVVSTTSTAYGIAAGTSSTKTAHKGLTFFLFLIFMTPLIAIPVWAALFVGSL